MTVEWPNLGRGGFHVGPIRNSKSVLNLAVRRSGELLSMNERAYAVTHHARK